MITSFLMVGQSNMAGRGYLKDVGQIYDEQIKMLVNGRWQTMVEPINHDRPTSGVGLAASFAGAWRLANESKQIGLIACADGGSSLDDWAVGGALFDHAVFQARLAQRTSTLAGFLWHQGENDSFGGRSAAYYDKLSVIVDAFRRALNVPEIPFIAGGMGEFLSSGRYGQYFTEYDAVNQALQRYADAKPDAFFVSATGLTANKDGLHFDAMSQRRFGVRYFEAFAGKKSILAPLAGEIELVTVLQDSPLSSTEKIAQLEIRLAGGQLSSKEFDEQLAVLRNTQ